MAIQPYQMSLLLSTLEAIFKHSAFDDEAFMALCNAMNRFYDEMDYHFRARSWSKEEFDSQVRTLCKRCGQIAAVKFVRAVRRNGLKDAHNYVKSVMS